MNIQNIGPLSCGVSSIDPEEMEIMRRLRAYGINPTGNKSTDKAKLHEIELKEAEKENCISNKFLTVSTSEQEKIQTKKKTKRQENNPDLHPEKFEGSKALGEQLYLALKMKNKFTTS